MGSVSYLMMLISLIADGRVESETLRELWFIVEIFQLFRCNRYLNICIFGDSNEKFEYRV